MATQGDECRCQCRVARSTHPDNALYRCNLRPVGRSSPRRASARLCNELPSGFDTPITFDRREDQLSDDTLPEFKYPIAEIYEGHKRLKLKCRRGSGIKLGTLIEAEYGVKDWQWTRLKVLYEAVLIQEDELAARLTRQVDDGEITVSTAYRLLRERDQNEEIVGALTSLKLHDLFQHHLGAASLAKVSSAALTLGKRLHRGELTEEELAKLPKLIRANGLHWVKVADQLARAMTGGTTNNGNRTQQQEPPRSRTED